MITPAGASGTPTSSGHESARSCLVCATNQATKGITPYLELDADGALEPGTYTLGFYARNPPSGPTPGTVRAQLRGYAGGALKWYRETTRKPLSAAFEKTELVLGVTERADKLEAVVYTSATPGECIDVDDVTITYAP